MTDNSEIVMTLPEFESSLYNTLGKIETAVKNSEFKEMWENSEYLTKYDFFLLCNDILESLGLPTLDSATLEKGWQYRNVLQDNFDDAVTEFCNLIIGWW